MNQYILILLQIIIGFASLIIAHMLGVYARETIRKHQQTKEHKLAINLLGNFIYYIVIIVSIVCIIFFYGFQITGIIAIISAFVFAIGLSLQGALSDITSGIILSLFDIYSIGDVIKINNEIGTVTKFNLINTTLIDVPTKQTITIPNGLIQKSILYNITKTGGIYVVIDISVDNQENHNYNEMVSMIQNELQNTVKYQNVIQYNYSPPFMIGVYKMYESGTILRAQVFIDSTNITQKRYIIMTNIRDVLSEKGIKLNFHN